MKQSHRVLSTYACDLFGICSALYELGGLIVMHDADGCNSTYNTHDEPRWYDIPSMAFISGLNEVDTIYGNDQRLIDNVADAAAETNPRFIVLGGSPMPNAIGTDFKAVAKLTEKRTGIPTLGFRTDGIQSYVWGAGKAFRDFGKKFMPAPEKIKEDGISVNDAKSGKVEKSGETGERPVRVNILGATPLDFSVTGTVTEIKKLIRDNGMELCACWAMGSNFDDIVNSYCADVNAVISSTGYELAKWMQETYGIPYVCGIPMGEKQTERWIGALRKAGLAGQVQSGKSPAENSVDPVQSGSEETEDPRQTEGHHEWLLIGEPVLMHSVRAALCAEYGITDVKILCPIRNIQKAMTRGILVTDVEDKLREECQRADHILADPIYSRLLPGETDKFTFLPQEAFSGRYFREEIPMFAGPRALDNIRDAAPGMREEIRQAHW
jgi:nitrogenase molybdenum-iron protein alpha/beta subunit